MTSSCIFMLELIITVELFGLSYMYLSTMTLFLWFARGVISVYQYIFQSRLNLIHLKWTKHRPVGVREMPVMGSTYFDLLGNNHISYISFPIFLMLSTSIFAASITFQSALIFFIDHTSWKQHIVGQYILVNH